MISLFRLTVFFFFSFFLCLQLAAQVDEVSEVTGLPIPIGAPVIYGQVIIRNIPRTERRPLIYVYLMNGGAQIEKFQANDRGYFYFLRAPIDGHTIHFEVDGTEVGRVIVTGGISNRFRQDVDFDWRMLKGGSPATSNSVISAQNSYDRTKEADKIFNQAMNAAKDNKLEEAAKLFGEILKADLKDHVSWMMLGLVHSMAKKFDLAESAYARSLELKPTYFSALLNAGKLEMSRKEFVKAAAYFAKAVEIDATSADANHLAGEAYLQMKKGSAAVGYLSKAIELAPIEKADIHLRLAALYNGAGLKDRASSEYKAFLEKVKNYPERKKLEQYIKDNPIK